MGRNNESLTTGVNLICEGTTIKGDVEVEKDFRIDGVIIGTLKTKGKIVIGETGDIQGDISCKTIDILGKVVGNIKVSDLAKIKETANIEGDIYSGKVAIEPGAKIIGKCNIGQVNLEKTITPEENKKEKNK